MTLGLSQIEPHGVARWIVLWAGLAGFSIITATVTFILQIQTSLHQRESAVLSLAGMTGSPPSGLRLLETMAQLHMEDELPDFFRGWRDWSASTLQSHLAHPVLGYFQSLDGESDWLFALGIVLDAATIIAVLTEDKSAGAATILHRSGSRMAARLCQLYDLKPPEIDPPDASGLGRLTQQLARAGYSVRQEHDLLPRLAELRSDYAERVAALAAHVGARPAPFIPEDC